MQVNFIPLYLVVGLWIFANLLHTMIPPLYKLALFRTINFIMMSEPILCTRGSTIFCGSVIMDLGRTLLIYAYLLEGATFNYDY